MKAEAVGHESELLRLTLTSDAVRRVGVQVTAAMEGDARAMRSVQGEVVAAPFAGGLPVGATMDLGTLSAGQSRADGDVKRARAELQVAMKAYARAEALLQEDAGSARARDEAESALAVARANVTAAESQRALLGPSLTRPNTAQALWVRAAVFASDLDRIDHEAPAEVRSLGGDTLSRRARPVNGPASANATIGTVDLFYALEGGKVPLRIGQRVAVDLTLRGQAKGLMVPAAAILRDIHGGEWAYVQVAPNAYERRRIEVASIRDGRALLARGLASGDPVVSAGAMELFGAEFGAK